MNGRACRLCADVTDVDMCSCRVELGLLGSKTGGMTQGAGDMTVFEHLLHCLQKDREEGEGNPCELLWELLIR